MRKKVLFGFLAAVWLFLGVPLTTAQDQQFSDPLGKLFRSLNVGMTREKVEEKLADALRFQKFNVIRYSDSIDLGWVGPDLLSSGAGPWSSLCISFGKVGISGIQYMFNYELRLLESKIKGRFCWDMSLSEQ